MAAYSSGNHAQAVALAGSLLGAPATILMPDDAPAAKRGPRAATARRWSGTTAMPRDREALGAALAAERGLTLVPPYEHPLVMAGQGTVALELLERVPELDALLVPVGGGGLWQAA